jgi:hypothetical protein
MCFVFYNTATQIFDSEMARQQLRSFNAAFKAPLSESEIRNTIKSVDTCVNVRGEQGYYILSLKRITEMLSISDEEADKLNFLISKRRSDRLKAKQKTASKRAERDALIIKLATDTTKTHLEIAEEVECSLRTVASVLKQAGLTKVRSEKTTERSPKKTQFTKCKKVATLSKVLGQYCLKPIKTFTFGIKPAENTSTIWKLRLPHSRISVSNGGLGGSKEFRFLRNFGFLVSPGFLGVP